MGAHIAELERVITEAGERHERAYLRWLDLKAQTDQALVEYHDSFSALVLAKVEAQRAALNDGGVCGLAHVDEADRAQCSGAHIDGQDAAD